MQRAPRPAALQRRLVVPSTASLCCAVRHLLTTHGVARQPDGTTDCAGYRIRHDKVGRGGTVTLRHKGRLHHIGIGMAFKHWRVVMLVAGLEIRILSLDGAQLGRLALDPTKDYQPIP